MAKKTNDYNTVDEIVRRFFKYLLKEYKNYEGRIERQDMIADAELVVLSNPKIAELYKAGNFNAALSLFVTKIRKEGVKWSALGKQENDRKAYERSKKRLALLKVEYEQLLLPENIELLEKVKNAVGEDDYEFVLDYYTIGTNVTAKLYGISKWKAIRKAKAIIEHIKQIVDK